MNNSECGRTGVNKFCCECSECKSLRRAMTLDTQQRTKPKRTKPIPTVDKRPPEDYDIMRLRGQKILAKLIPRLNKISDSHIRLRKEDYRREEDFDEMCILAALLSDYKGE